MSISPQSVQELRQMTGAGMMDAKQALVDAGGDVEKAVLVLRKKGALKAEKKSSRETKEGRVTSYIHATGKVGVLLKLYSETDFVSRNEQFQEFCKKYQCERAEWEHVLKMLFGQAKAKPYCLFQQTKA